MNTPSLALIDTQTDAEAREAATMAEGQRLMMLGFWHQQDNPLLRCNHGFRNKLNCRACHSWLDYPHVMNVK